MKVNPESDQLSTPIQHSDVQVGPTGSEKFRQVLGGTVSLAGQLATGVAGASTMGLGPLGGNLVSGLLGGGAGSTDPMALLQIQQQLQNESQVFNTMSNISKTEHETRMSAVRNMKE